MEAASHAMNGGDGIHSYAKNSSFQKMIVDEAKQYIKEAIDQSLEISNFSSITTFRVADLGCSVGPNTFLAVHNIIEGLELKYREVATTALPEFEVLFNDHASNDFNRLFASLPRERRYMAMGVPGSFYGRLFPRASLHVVHCSTSLHWLSRVPSEVLDRSSSCWNGGRIHYKTAPVQVARAFAAQHRRDMGRFLEARAREVVCGGLVAIAVTTLPDGTHHSESWDTFDMLESCFLQLVHKGMISAERVDTFNIPFYCPTPKEIKTAVEENGEFSLERLERLASADVDGLSEGEVAKMMSGHMRAVLEELIRDHFGCGDELVDALFDSYSQLMTAHFKIGSHKQFTSFIILKRNPM